MGEEQTRLVRSEILPLEQEAMTLRMVHGLSTRQIAERMSSTSTRPRPPHKRGETRDPKLRVRIVTEDKGFCARCGDRPA